MRLPTLGIGRTLNKDAAQYPRLPDATKAKEAAEPDKFAPQGLSMSREEQFIHDYLVNRRGYWQQQLQIGERRQPRNTSADFYSDYYKAVIQADGSYYHDPKRALDEILSSVIRQRGYRVFRFRYPDFEYVVREFPKWYNQPFAS